MHQMRSLTTGTQAEKVGNRKNLKTVKEPEKNPKYCVMKLSQIRRRIKLHVCMREVILRFEMNL
jgi:hypothetical protein